MKLEQEILLNKYGQGVIDKENILSVFLNLDKNSQKKYFADVIFLIEQSKVKTEDIEKAIVDCGLKSTYTPCVLLKKGIEPCQLYKIANLPENERTKSIKLLLSLFKVAYYRRYTQEKNNPNKWWYWDLSDPNNVECVIRANS